MRKAPLILRLLRAAVVSAQEKRHVIIDQDAAGPGGADMMSILVLLQSPAVEPLGIDVDMPKFAAMFVRLMTSPTPHATSH